MNMYNYLDRNGVFISPLDRKHHKKLVKMYRSSFILSLFVLIGIPIIIWIQNIEDVLLLVIVLLFGLAFLFQDIQSYLKRRSINARIVFGETGIQEIGNCVEIGEDFSYIVLRKNTSVKIPIVNYEKRLPYSLYVWADTLFIIGNVDDKGRIVLHPDEIATPFFEDLIEQMRVSESMMGML